MVFFQRKDAITEMKLIEKKNQNRRDFNGIYRCENCGEIEEVDGYDDRNFHDNVMPARECKSCGKSTNDLGVEKEHVPTKYPDYMVV